MRLGFLGFPPASDPVGSRVAIRFPPAAYARRQGWISAIGGGMTPSALERSVKALIKWREARRGPVFRGIRARRRLDPAGVLECTPDCAEAHGIIFARMQAVIFRDSQYAIRAWWRDNGAPAYVALACAAIVAQIPP